MKSPMIDEYKCGCVITGDKLGIITWDKCAIHSKAPAMYEALKKLKSQTEWALNDPGDSWRPPEWIAKEIHAVVTSALEGL